MMLAYSLLLLLALTLSSPWWLTRMLTTQRYREGLTQRLGRVPRVLREYARGHRIVWLHAVSVGEVLAATRLVAELEAALRSQKDDSFRIVISTTTRTGQALARQRFGSERVFYYPLDLAFAVRTYLDALKPEALILMESELWPRMLAECSRRGIPVSVVNARVSDRSFRRAQRFRAIWSRLLAKVTLFLAQSEEDARRLVSLGARVGGVCVSGNLKYDVRPALDSEIARLVREAAGSRPIIVAGSTVDASPRSEDSYVIHAWEGAARREHNALLVLAPRHPERFETVASMAIEFPMLRATDMLRGMRSSDAYSPHTPREENLGVEIILLDTIGDLAGVYQVASVAFVGGSMIPRGGHNPLEPAQFGVPVVIGPSYENFRDIAGKLHENHGLVILPGSSKDIDPSNVPRMHELKDSLDATFAHLLMNPAEARVIGERGREVFVTETGATARTVDALLQLIPSGGPR